MFIGDFRELGYAYLKYCGGNYINCCECGRLIKQNKYGNKKYCAECAAYIPKEYKAVTCVDCGTEFVVDAKNNQSCRCSKCYTIYRRKYYKEKKREQREKLKMSTEQFGEKFKQVSENPQNMGEI